ncbi:hypothetical protein EAI_05540 [Harpegnathos saltator]|uniref:Uncharacterized protein n=1 Tax=Harpegnathos saltator TaxID=610380 RepID=E2C190_HARSA|nr:hypothetical protein EAI_05540 [Harpegnathos saltator]
MEKRRGRPTNAEKLRRDSTSSMGSVGSCIEVMWEGKRKTKEEGEEGEQERAMKKNTKIGGQQEREVGGRRGMEEEEEGREGWIKEGEVKVMVWKLMEKGVEIGEKGVEEGMKEIWQKLELEVEVREAKRIGKGDKKGEGMVLVKLGSVEQKRKVMEAKKKLRG